jgi:hypothetical protein
VKFQILPADPTIVNAFIEGLRVYRIEPFIGLDKDGQPEPKVAVTFDPAMTAEEQMAREVEAVATAKAQEDLRVAELRRVAGMVVGLRREDVEEYQRLKNTGQRTIWLSSRGFAKGDAALAVDLLTVEMMPTTMKLASQYKAVSS